LHPARRAAGVAAALVLTSAPLSAEIYQWTDADGRVHFTAQLDRVPPEQREAAKRGTRSGSSGSLQIYDSSPASASAPQESRGGMRAAPIRRELHIPFERMGTLMRVNVRINDSMTVPFLIDTGASGVALPSTVAERLGIRVGPDTPHVTVQTAAGIVSRPVVRLESVELGGARVEGIEAILNPSMEIGLLGGTFFNNYVYRVDAAASVITLSPNEQMRGGLDSAGWRARFQELRSPLARLEAYLVPENPIRKDERERLEQKRAELTALLDGLEAEANRQSVPQAWRQ
jgi:clan AA aspartic protease (TIGR02281 family)